MVKKIVTLADELECSSSISTSTFEQLMEELNKDPEFIKAYEQRKKWFSWWYGEPPHQRPYFLRYILWKYSRLERLVKWSTRKWWDI
jgi:hypothetical protein